MAPRPWKRLHTFLSVDSHVRAETLLVLEPHLTPSVHEVNRIG